LAADWATFLSTASGHFGCHAEQWRSVRWKRPRWNCFGKSLHFFPSSFFSVFLNS
jgi:hypothetical protein